MSADVADADAATRDWRALDEGEWRARLSDVQFTVTRKAGTERAFSGPHLNEKRVGAYRCVCCDAELFASDAKYDSGTGWPSFSSAVTDAVGEKSDRSFFMRRTEVHCVRCAAHLGHVFPDGPPPTGRRFCINGAALTFAPRDGGDPA